MTRKLFILALLVLLRRYTNSSSNSVIMKASHSILKHLEQDDQKSVKEWIKIVDSTDVLNANPSLIGVQVIAPGRLRSNLTPVRVPGLEVMQTIDLEYRSDNQGFILRSIDDSVKQKYRGSRIISRLFSNSRVHLKWQTKFEFNEALRAVRLQGDVEMGMLLPCMLIPGLHRYIQESGQRALQSSLQNDLDLFIENLVSVSKCWKTKQLTLSPTKRMYGLIKNRLHRQADQSIMLARTILSRL